LPLYEPTDCCSNEAAASPTRSKRCQLDISPLLTVVSCMNYRRRKFTRGLISRERQVFGKPPPSILTLVASCGVGGYNNLRSTQPWRPASEVWMTMTEKAANDLNPSHLLGVGITKPGVRPRGTSMTTNRIIGIPEWSLTSSSQL